MIYNNVLELIGNTPLIRAINLEEKYNLEANVYLKLERFNLTGSSKDRLALKIINEGFKKGLINENTTIIEPTSGNTGISLSAICSYLKLKCIIVMPDNMSIERINLIKAYGASVILTDGNLGMSGSINKVNELHKEIINSYIPSQFENENGNLAHYETTGPEIFNDLNGKVDVFIASIGTGTTFTGTSRYLKEKCNTYCVGVEPLNSPLLNGGEKGSHKIQGIGANFIPKTLDVSLLDYVYDASDEDSYFYCKELLKEEGIFCGISSGACIACLINIAKKKEYKGKNIVVILPDSGERYISTGVFND